MTSIAPGSFLICCFSSTEPPSPSSKSHSPLSSADFSFLLESKAECKFRFKKGFSSLGPWQLYRVVFGALTSRSSALSNDPGGTGDLVAWRFRGSREVAGVVAADCSCSEDASPASFASSFGESSLVLGMISEAAVSSLSL